MPIFTHPHTAGFHFWPSVVSHGWCDLPPFRCDEDTRTLERIHQLSDGAVVRLILPAAEAKAGSITVHVEGIDSLNDSQIAEMRRGLGRSLEIDRDLTGFYALVAGYPRYAWIEQLGAGRLLSTPSVWENLVKTLFTTNTTWSMTIQMTERTVTLGDAYAGGGIRIPHAAATCQPVG